MLAHLLRGRPVFMDDFGKDRADNSNSLTEAELANLRSWPIWALSSDL